MTYRAFLSPEELLEKLLCRLAFFSFPFLFPFFSFSSSHFNPSPPSLFRYQPTIVHADAEASRQRVRVVGVLKAWVEQFFYDFEEQSMEDAFLAFLEEMVCICLIVYTILSIECNLIELHLSIYLLFYFLIIFFSPENQYVDLC